MHAHKHTHTHTQLRIRSHEHHSVTYTHTNTNKCTTRTEHCSTCVRSPIVSLSSVLFFDPPPWRTSCAFKRLTDDVLILSGRRIVYNSSHRHVLFEVRIANNLCGKKKSASRFLYHFLFTPPRAPVCQLSCLPQGACVRLCLVLFRMYVQYATNMW
jgi:hypothetical protein